MSTGWVKDRLDPSIWYYTGEAKDATEGSMATGWVTDPQDGQKYYMDPVTGQMSHGWVKIDNAWYYFTESQYANRSLTAASQTGHSYGSMYRNEKTPDGYYVDGTGSWRQSSGSSGSSSSGGRRPTPTPTPTPTPEPVMTATAATSTAQYAGRPFDTTGLTIKVFKDGAEYATVTLPDENKIPAAGIKVTVKDVEDGTLSPGSNNVKIEFVYYDSDVLIGQSMTTEVFTVDGITYTVTFDANGHEFDTPINPITDVTYGSTITAPATPTTAGYPFGGWYKEAACTNAWNFGSDVVTADTTLYAKWIQLFYPEISGLDAALANKEAAEAARNAGAVFNVPLTLNATLTGDSEKPYDWPVQIYNVATDGTVTFGPALGQNSILFGNIALTYRTWNSGYLGATGADPAANYATSRMRATLIGKDGFTPSSYADASTCLTSGNCLLSCFPDSLTGKDKGADYKYGIVAREMKVPTKWDTSSPYTINDTATITDKLWLFSANELYGGLSSDYLYGEERGTQMQLPEGLGVTDRNYSALKCYKDVDVGSAIWRWLRSPSRYFAMYATIVSGDGNLGAYYNSHVATDSIGLAPGFCLKVLN